jgi:LPXTG-site transpeptidase (sortase) family protein
MNINASKKSATSYFFSFGMMFFLSLSAAHSVGFVPYYVDGTEQKPRVEETEVALGNLPMLGEEEAQLLPTFAYASAVPAYEPTRIVINGVGIDLPVLNPEATDIPTLDEELKKGAVRYPNSALPGQRGNVLIFGHSSHLPVVHNQMYRAFNMLPEVKKDDFITLEGNGYAYLYRVTEVRKADANEEYVDLSPEQGAKLTLSTCDTFGAKSARWIVEADFVSSYELGQ